MNILINGITIGEGSILPTLIKAKYWQKQKHEITIFGPKCLQKEIKNYKRFYRFRSIKLKWDKPITNKIQFIFESLKRNIISLAYIPKIKNKFDVVHSISSMLDFLIFPYFLKLYNPNIIWVTVFDNVVPLTDPGNKAIRFLAWCFFNISLVLLKKADVIFVISPELKEFLIKHHFTDKKVVITGNGVDIELLNKAKKDSKLNIDSLFVGRINETKGIYLMLKVLKKITKIYPKFQFAVMGRGDSSSEKQFKEKIKSLNLTSNVQLLGYKKGIEKFSIIKSSKCFWFLSVSPSESFGIALMEAVCCGIPAITYDLPIFKKIYKNKEIIQYPKGSIDQVVKATIDIFKKNQFSNLAGQKLLQKYSWDRISQLELDTIKSLYEIKR